MEFKEEGGSVMFEEFAKERNKKESSKGKKEKIKNKRKACATPENAAANPPVKLAVSKQESLVVVAISSCHVGVADQTRHWF